MNIIRFYPGISEASLLTSPELFRSVQSGLLSPTPSKLSVVAKSVVLITVGGGTWGSGVVIDQSGGNLHMFRLIRLTHQLS